MEQNEIYQNSQDSPIRQNDLYFRTSDDETDVDIKDEIYDLNLQLLSDRSFVYIPPDEQALDDCSSQSEDGIDEELMSCNDLHYKANQSQQHNIRTD
ncbi:UNKNOWN [Stylonychia lemnae]|uniref:Uncharacterized protein n=1 Tax=Stylonychia lemnae TaxID=5949 RepID=A0A077ZZM2_STYLE|nr:UNKNOWN [Stylonychia lemnae]|eukprot:CDW75057.1 UNKNOWN [Stylonychia lemnae]